MPPQAHTLRFCIIDRDAGPVTVQLRANNGLQCGAEFKVIITDTGTVETFELATGAPGTAERNIATEPTRLLEGGLSWEFLVCSLSAQVDAGRVEIVLLQDGVSCPLTKPTSWLVEQIPECAAAQDNVVAQRGSLIFRSA